MKFCQNKILLAERLAVLLFLIGYFYINAVISPNSSIPILAGTLQHAVYPMWLWVLLIFTLGPRLIYRNSLKNEVQPTLRNYAYLWFCLFYIPYLGFGFFLDVWSLFFGNDQWVGLLLFLLKLAVIFYLGMVLRKTPTVTNAFESGQEEISEKASSGDVGDVIGIAGMIVLSAVDACFITPTSSLDRIIGILQLVILIFILFRPQHESNTKGAQG